MKPHKLFPFVFLAILIASLDNFCGQAQEALPKGIVFYKTSSASNSDTAQATEYQSLEPASVVVNGISLEGAEFTIQRNRLAEVITYPNLRTIRTPAEIEAFKDAGRKLTNAKSAYPLAAKVITSRLEAFTEIALKLNKGAALVEGVWQPPTDEKPDMKTESPSGNTPSARSGGNGNVSISEVGGAKYSGIRILNQTDSSVTFMHQGGVKTLPWASLTSESQLALGYDAEALAMQKQKLELENADTRRASEVAFQTILSMLGFDPLPKVLAKVPEEATGTWTVTATVDIHTKAVTGLNEPFIMTVGQDSIEFSETERGPIIYVAADYSRNLLFLSGNPGTLLMRIDQVVTIFDINSLAQDAYGENFDINDYVKSTFVIRERLQLTTFEGSGTRSSASDRDVSSRQFPAALSQFQKNVEVSTGESRPAVFDQSLFEKLCVEKLAFASGSYAPGDIPEGTYAFVEESGGNFTEKTGGEILGIENFPSFGYVRVHGIGNVSIRGKLLSAEALRKLGFAGAKSLFEALSKQPNYQFSGHYLIGLDLPPGTYRIESVGNGYYSVNNGPVGDEEVLKNGSLKGAATVSVTSGQILELSKCKIAP